MMNKKKALVFLIGAGHSGSTLVSKTLNAHSKIFSVSEISQFQEDIQKEKSLCGCGTQLKECVFWENVNKNLKTKLGYGIKDKPECFEIIRDKNKKSFINKASFRASRLFALNFRTKTKFIKSRLKHSLILFDSIFEITNAEIIIDSSKSAKRASLLKSYFRSNGYNVFIIHLVRDGRAVFYSYKKGYYAVKMKDEVTGELEMKTFYADKPKTNKEIVNLWKTDNRLSKIYHASSCSSKYYKLMYEQFANYPEEELIKLLRFIGLEFEKEMLDLTRYENHMVSGNASRINAVSINPPSEMWRNKLSQEQIAYFNKKAGRMNRKFGYI